VQTQITTPRHRDAARGVQPRLRRHRLQIAALCALAVVLVLEGPERALGGEEIADPPSSVGSEHIEAILDTWNPNLGSEVSGRIAEAVVRYSRHYGLAAELVTAVLLVESSARPWAESPKGAIGLMQVMPYMMEPLDLAGNATTIESNIEAGCWILANNIRRLGEERGISAYFWGSKIRDLAYLEKVQEARLHIRRSAAS